MSDVITSTANPRIKAIRELHRAKARKVHGRTLIEGPSAFTDFLAAGFKPLTVLCEPHDKDTIDACHRSNVEFTLVTNDVLGAASDTKSPRGPVAVIEIPPPHELRSHHTAVLVDISDPGNVGTMIRTATALGWDVAATGTTADFWSPKVIRSGAGAHSRARLVVVQDPLDAARTHGLRVLATVVEGGQPPEVHDEPVALLVGSEAHGLPDDVISSADERITIPLPGGLESLNAAAAGAIAMYAIAGSHTR